MLKSPHVSVPPAENLNRARSKLEWALDAARRGFGVFPVCWTDPAGGCSCRNAKCRSAGKHPLEGSHGHQDATQNVGQIVKLWDETPEANIGLSPGLRGVVFDLDRKGGKDGLISLARHLDVDPLDLLVQTHTVRTPTGGYHLYFEATEPARCSVNVMGLKGVDVRGVNGYVLAPGSIIGTASYEHAFELNQSASSSPRFAQPVASRQARDTEALTDQSNRRLGHSEGNHRGSRVLAKPQSCRTGRRRRCLDISHRVLPSRLRRF